MNTHSLVKTDQLRFFLIKQESNVCKDVNGVLQEISEKGLCFLFMWYCLMMCSICLII